jgi:hypothetical protein
VHSAGNRPHREYFSITPTGFYFRQKEYKSIEHLLASFKKNPTSGDKQLHGVPFQPALAAPASRQLTGVPYQVSWLAELLRFVWNLLVDQWNYSTVCNFSCRRLLQSQVHSNLTHSSN